MTVFQAANFFRRVDIPHIVAIPVPPMTTPTATTKMLLHCDGTDGSTTITDTTGLQTSITASGNAQIDTAQSKFGGASLMFDGTGDFITVPTTTDFDFGTGDFTVDMWTRAGFLLGGLTQCLVDFQPHRIQWEGFTFEWREGANFITSSSSFAVSTWYHVALTREGTTVRLFVNGALEGSITNSTNLLNTNTRFGTRSSGVDPYQGWHDEIRIVKGTAIWTAAFTPPTSAWVLA
jgi:hypothetical protein